MSDGLPRLRSLVLALIALAVTVTAGRSAVADPAEYGCSKPIRFAYYEFGALFHAGVGIDRDVVEELAARTGCVFETQTRLRAEIWAELQAGTLDMTNSGIRTEARRKFAYFIPYLGWRNVLVTRPDVAAAAQTLDDIVAHREWRIGVVRGYLHGPYYDFRLKAAAAGGSVVYYPDQDSIYRALKAGEVQAIVSPAVNYGFYLKTAAEQGDFLMLPDAATPPIPHNMIFATARFTAPEINAWARLFERMRLDGTLLRIYRRHLPAGMAAAILDY